MATAGLVFPTDLNVVLTTEDRSLKLLCWKKRKESGFESHYRLFST